MAYSPAIKTACHDEYITGSVEGVATIAKKHGVVIETLRNWIAQEDWVKEKRDVWEKARKNRKPLDQQISEMNTRHNSLWQLFEGQLVKVFQHYQGMKNPMPAANLNALASVMERIQRGRHLACGITDENNVQEIVIEYAGLKDLLKPAKKKEVKDGK